MDKRLYSHRRRRRRSVFSDVLAVGISPGQYTRRCTRYSRGDFCARPFARSRARYVLYYILRYTYASTHLDTRVCICVRVYVCGAASTREPAICLRWCRTAPIIPSRRSRNAVATWYMYTRTHCARLAVARRKHFNTYIGIYIYIYFEITV